MRSALRRISRARSVMSDRLPMGVGTRMTRPEISVEVSMSGQSCAFFFADRFRTADVIHTDIGHAAESSSFPGRIEHLEVPSHRRSADAGNAEQHLEAVTS